jgi:EamA domain-containing membrane protein RarD
MKNSSWLQLNLSDLGKSALIAFLGAFLSVVITIVDAGSLPTLAALGTAAVFGLKAAGTYLLKNFLTNDEGKIQLKKAA